MQEVYSHLALSCLIMPFMLRFSLILFPLRKNHAQAIVRFMDPIIKTIVRKEQNPFVGIETPSLESLPVLGDYPFLSSVCDQLINYNNSIGCEAIDSIRKLRQGSPCVVTGQQLGFMGGPIYTILKGISALLVARELGAIPIFWLATEDHDLDEINHTYTLSPRGDLQRYRLKFPHQPLFVEDLILRAGDISEIERFMTSVSINIPIPKIGERYATAMARLLAFLFRGTPMLFIEPYLLRPFSYDFFKEELISAPLLEQLLIQQTDHLAEQQKITPIQPSGATHLFFKTKEGYRQKITWEENSFNIGRDRYTEKQILALLASGPEKFSCGVAARPLLQSYHLPVQAYIAGPTEVRYLLQLQPLFTHHQLPLPLVIPRIHATLLTKEAADVLEKCHLNPWDILPKSWKDWDGANTIFGSFFANAFTDEENSVIVRAGKTRPAAKEKRGWQELLEAQKIPTYGLHLLNQLLHPHGHEQERVLNWCYFDKEDGPSLVQKLLPLLSWKEEGHYYLYI